VAYGSHVLDDPTGWRRSHSRVDQLRDNLVAIDLTLSPEGVARLEQATDFTLGFPGDFIAQTSPGSSARPYVRCERVSALSHVR
jgi:hypothetical protein